MFYFETTNSFSKKKVSYINIKEGEKFVFFLFFNEIMWIISII